MHDFMAMLGQQTQGALGAAFPIRRGEIVSYDEDNVSVVVRFLPGGELSGDIPLYGPWAGRKDVASGFQGGPTPGTLALVLAFDIDGNDLAAIATSYSAKNNAPGAAAGEVTLAHSPESYVKMKNDDRTYVGGKEAVEVISPLIELKAVASALGDADAVVRKADLQVVVDYINNTLRPWLMGSPYVAGFGTPCVPNPGPYPAFLAAPCPEATASSVAKAQD